MSATTEILTIGTEILSGSVLDTNSHWLCQQLVARGIEISRITTVPDRPDVIGDEVRSAVRRKPALLLCSGGLGPTADDLTLASVATALGLTVEQHPEALAMVAAFYTQLEGSSGAPSGVLTPEREKMSYLPAGSAPLRNAVGAAPGVLLSVEDLLIACLPGVPAEMRAIFTDSLWPRISGTMGGSLHLERILSTDCYDESLMAAAVDALAADFPDLYVKSRAQAYGSGVADFVTLSARGADRDQLMARLDAAEDQLRQSLAGLGVAIRK